MNYLLAFTIFIPSAIVYAYFVDAPFYVNVCAGMIMMGISLGISKE